MTCYYIIAKINLVLRRSEYFDWVMLFAGKYMSEKVKFFFMEEFSISSSILFQTRLHPDVIIKTEIKSLIKSRKFVFKNPV